MRFITIHPVKDFCKIKAWKGAATTMKAAVQMRMPRNVTCLQTEMKPDLLASLTGLTLDLHLFVVHWHGSYTK